MQLELGCGKNPTPGYVHHDRIKHAPHVDVAHDLDVFPWPWADESCGDILGLDVVEHLRSDVQQWLDECWRILVPLGSLILRVPAWDHWTSWVDPTHRRPFHLQTFDYWDKSTFFHQQYGCIYFAESNRWWRVERATAQGDGALSFVLRKVAE